MIKDMDHPPYVQRHPFPRRVPIPVLSNRVGAFRAFQFRTCPEQSTVVRHVEHGHVPYRPCLDRIIARPIHKHGQVRIYFCCQVSIPAGAENWWGACIGFTTVKFSALSGKHFAGSRTSLTSCRKNAHWAGAPIGERLPI